MEREVQPGRFAYNPRESAFSTSGSARKDFFISGSFKKSSLAVNPDHPKRNDRVRSAKRYDSIHKPTNSTPTRNNFKPAQDARTT